MTGVGRESHTAKRSCRASKPKPWTSRSSASGLPWVHVPRRRMGCLSPSTRPNLIARPLFLGDELDLIASTQATGGVFALLALGVDGDELQRTAAQGKQAGV